MYGLCVNGLGKIRFSYVLHTQGIYARKCQRLVVYETADPKCGTRVLFLPANDMNYDGEDKV